MAEITVIESYSPEETGKLGRKLGENAKPGERFRKTLDRLGEDGLKEKVMAAYNGK